MLHLPRCGSWLWCLALALSGAHSALAQDAASKPDTDRDGLSDEYEQIVLEKLRPTIMINAQDCAARPARFAAGRRDPEVVSADGTIYGQVFPVSGGLVEVHYYTL
jgi:hypothetical protein